MRLHIQVEDAADVVFHVNTLDLLLYVLSKIWWNIVQLSLKNHPDLVEEAEESVECLLVSQPQREPEGVG